MSFLKTSKYLAAILAAAAFLAFGTANAATLQLDFGVSFGDPTDTDTAQPDGPAPWMTAIIDDGGSAGSATLTLALPSTINLATVSQVYLNFDDVQGVENLSITRTGEIGTIGTVNILTGTDGYKADADGWFDILLDLPPPGNKFEAGESLIFDIQGSGAASAFVASDFAFFSTPDPIDPNGPFLGAAKFGSTGSDTVQCDSLNGPIGQCSDWVGVVPVPGAVWLFGSALGLLGWMRRRS